MAGNSSLTAEGWVANVPPLRVQGETENTLIFMGDSIAANAYVATATATAFVDFGFMTWANAFSGWRFEILNPAAALGGTTSADWVARIDTEVLPYNPGWVVCYLGTNDISGDIPYTQTVGNLKYIFDRILRSGSRLVVCTVLPYGASFGLLTAARNVARNRLNKWLSDYCSANGGAYLCDTHAAVIDPASATGAALANYLHDDLHPSARGARAMGAALSAVLTKNTVDSSPHVSAFSDNFAYDASASNRISNPLFNSATGTAGASSAGSGTTITATSIARDWTVATAAGGASTTVCTTPTAPDGIGNSQHLAITGANATDAITLRTGSIASARLSAGDRLYAEVFVKVASASALQGIRLQWSYAVDGVTYNHTCMSFQNTSYDTADVSQMVLRTPTFQVPAGTLTSGQLQVVVEFNGSGAATVDVWRAALRKVN